MTLVFVKGKVQLLGASQYCVQSFVMFLYIHSIDYDIITNIFNIWNVANDRGNHILKLFSSSIDAKTETFVSEQTDMSRERGNVP